MTQRSTAAESVEKEGSSWFIYFIFFIFVVIIAAFLVINVFGFDLSVSFFKVLTHAQKKSSSKKKEV